MWRASWQKRKKKKKVDILIKLLPLALSGSRQFLVILKHITWGRISEWGRTTKFCQDVTSRWQMSANVRAENEVVPGSHYCDTDTRGKGWWKLRQSRLLLLLLFMFLMVEISILCSCFLSNSYPSISPPTKPITWGRHHVFRVQGRDIVSLNFSLLSPSLTLNTASPQQLFQRPLDAFFLHLLSFSLRFQCHPRTLRNN